MDRNTYTQTHIHSRTHTYIYVFKCHLIHQQQDLVPYLFSEESIMLEAQN